MPSGTVQVWRALQIRLGISFTIRKIISEIVGRASTGLWQMACREVIPIRRLEKNWYAVPFFTDTDACYLKEVDKGLTEAEAGDFIPHEQVVAHVGLISRISCESIVTVRWSSGAEKNLVDALLYLLENAPEQADGTIRQVPASDGYSDSFPRYWKTRQRVRRTRELVLTPLPYIVVYAVSRRTVHILRIFDGRRGWKR